VNAIRRQEAEALPVLFIQLLKLMPMLHDSATSCGARHVRITSLVGVFQFTLSNDAD
jgi:hypothetical protein